MPSPHRKWIFIRGLGRHSLHWGPFVHAFQKHFPKDEVELLDLRGNGNLAHSPSCLSMADNVRDLRARSKFIKSHESVFLMTISLGSMVGVEWAHRHPQEVNGLVTINTSDRGTSPFFERMRPQNYPSLLQTLFNSPGQEALEQTILKMTCRNPDLHKEWLPQFAKSPATTRSNFLRQLLAASTYEFPTSKPKTEILMLCSEGDQLVSPKCTKRIAQMWTLKPHVHPQAGHDIPLEDPDWICIEVQNWLKNSLFTEETPSSL